LTGCIVVDVVFRFGRLSDSSLSESESELDEDDEEEDDDEEEEAEDDASDEDAREGIVLTGCSSSLLSSEEEEAEYEASFLLLFLILFLGAPGLIVGFDIVRSLYLNHSKPAVHQTFTNTNISDTAGPHNNVEPRGKDLTAPQPGI
jgi:hypothetical protein